MVSMVSSISNALTDVLMPMLMEICFVLFFPVGWLLVSKLADYSGLKLAGKAGTRGPSLSSAAQAQSDKTHAIIKDHVVSGNLDDAVKAWRQVQQAEPTSADILRLVVRSLAAVCPETLVQDIGQHLEQHAAVICDTKSSAAILDVLSTCQNVKLVEGMHRELHGRLGINMTIQAYEALLSANAAAGDEARVKELIAEIHGSQQKLTARPHALVVKGFLQNGMLDPAMTQAQAMLKQGFYVPSFAITQFLKLAGEVDRTEDIFSQVLAHMDLPAEAVGLLFEDCVKRCDAALAQKVERLVRKASKGVLPLSTYGSFLKVLVAAADPRAQEVFQEMQKLGAPMHGNFLQLVVARCAESKFLCFAQNVADFLRAREEMTVPMYSALIKVYSACGFHAQACDLYTEMRERGLQPDSTMCSNLMKLAVKAGRSDLTQTLFETMPQADVQQSMVVIQAAGRNKDVERVFAVLDKLRNSGQILDSAVYNCVLDACINAGEVKRAHTLMQEMRANKMVDIISYNTMIKGCISLGNVKAAQQLFDQVESEGLKPTDITYNCMIYTAVSSGDFRPAWDIIDKMERSGMKLDQYTVSIIMRGLKTQHGKRRDVQRAMALLDRISFNLCSDGVVLSIAIETCIKYQELDRVDFLVKEWEKSSLKPCAHTTAGLIKAYSVLSKLDRCRDLWRQALRERGVESNDILLGCMLEALVSNSRVDEALAVFNEVKDRLPPNMIIYSTLAKGFAAQGRVNEAMDLWREIRATGAKLNTVLYNILIDGQARKGAMEQVDQLLRAMTDDECEKDNITFCTVVKGHCINGDIERAFSVFKDMNDSGVHPDCVVYNTILDSCVQNGRMDLADKTLAEMKRFKITPSGFTLGILVKMYGRRQQLDMAFAAVEEFKTDHGVIANMQVCTCLMSACMHNKDMDRALQVFDQMRDLGVDARAYAVLVSGLLRAGRIQEAVEAVEDAYGLSAGKRRVLPPRQHLSAECLERLFFAIKQQDLQEKYGLPLLGSLRAAGVPLQVNVLTSILDSERKGPGGSAGGGRRRGH